MQKYKALLKISRETAVLKGVSQLLSWDQETYMPHDAAAARAEQCEVLAGLVHKQEVSKKFANALGKLIDLETGHVIARELADEYKAALREWRRNYLLQKKLPERFVKAFAKLTSEAIHVWALAKKSDSFQKFAPYLDKVIQMSQKKAEYLGYSDHPYDALLDEYEPGMTTKEIDRLFADLKGPVTRLVKQLREKKKPDVSFLHAEHNHDTQMQASLYFLEEMGYDFGKGRLDLSSHPFSTSFHPTDARVTTRLHATSFMNNIGTTLHEGGHALYEQGLPEEHFGSPLCEAVSLGIHESQSRFWETRIGQSKAFWNVYLPYLKKQFKMRDVSLDDFYRAINLVQPSPIRVDADEVTYSLHIILRFELEKELIAGRIKTREIPEAWNAKMQEYLGLVPKNNAEGCLQDIHWSMGGFGYFPTYTLGNLFAAHFFLAFEQAFPNWQEKIATDGLLFIKEWLNQKIHRHGKRYTSHELVENITGQKLSSAPYIHYLESKYKGLEAKKNRLAKEFHEAALDKERNIEIEEWDTLT